MRHIGENYIQHFTGHRKAIEANWANPADITWHFIGKLQSKKIGFICKHFDWIQTIENEVQLEKIQSACAMLEREMSCLIQVNIASESSKSGVGLDELDNLISKFQHTKNCNLRGFMMMPPLSENHWIEYSCELFKQLQKKYNEMEWDTLSLGTSEDWQYAVSKGSNMVRLGEVLLGKRK